MTSYSWIRTTTFEITTPGVDFINILRANFSRAKFDGYFGEWQLANGARHLANLSGIFSHKFLRLNVGEIKRRIFFPNAVRRPLFAWQKSLVKSTPGVGNYFRPWATLCIHSCLVGHILVKKGHINLTKIGSRGPYVTPSWNTLLSVSLQLGIWA